MKKNLIIYFVNLINSHIIMKISFKLSLIIFLTFFVISCAKDSDDINCVDEDLILQNIGTICVEVYEPVCGCNNETYSNECYARKAGIVSFADGECN
tara:strand:+ start:1995 stop:2285 length:291 start_codon:yes stop_codon:yes gene_type:complete